MSISSEMQGLCADIISAAAGRAGRLGTLRRETNALQGDARRIIMGFHNSFQAMARGLRAERKLGQAARKQSVAELRADYRKTFCATRADLAVAQGIWAAMAKG